MQRHMQGSSSSMCAEYMTCGRTIGSITAAQAMRASADHMSSLNCVRLGKAMLEFSIEILIVVYRSE
jgi:hypothetical protein